MKNKLLILAVMIFAIVAIFAVTASAEAYGEANIYYFDATVDELATKSAEDAMFWCTRDASDIITTYSGSFPKTNKNGEAISWYKLGQATVGDNIFVAVSSFVTTDSDYCTIDANGMYKFTSSSGVTKHNIVSVNFPNDAGIESFSNGSNYGLYAQTGDYKPANSELLFAYFPNTWQNTDRVVQATPCIEAYFDKDSTFTTLGDLAFYQCKSLRKVVLPSSLTVINGGAGAFYNCINLPDTGINLLDTEITEIGNNTFNGCIKFEKIAFPNTFEKIGARALQSCSNLVEIRLGANFKESTDISSFYLSHSVRYVYLPNTLTTLKSHAFGTTQKGMGTSDMVFFYTGSVSEFENFRTNGLATNNERLANAVTIAWDAEKGEQYFKDLATTDNKCYVVYGYNKCDAFYDAEHDLGTVNSCMVDVECGRTCGYSVVSEFDTHKIVESLVYENGFDKNGVYNCICSNASYCTSIDGYAVNVEKAPIITAKGYSVPLRAGAEIAINAGFDVKTDLLKKFEELNPESTVTIGLAMVNAKTAISAGAILDGEELAENVKGFAIKVTSNSYSSISIEIKGFEDNGDNTGSYYDLKLITVAYVKIDDEVHYIQHGGSATTTETIGDVAYKVVTANSVYTAQA